MFSESLQFRWLKIKRIYAAFPVSITLYFNRLKQNPSSYLTIMCRFQNMNDIFEHFIFFFNKSMAIVPPKFLIGMNWAPR